MTGSEEGELPTTRWRLLVAYDGSRFRGFAAQPGIVTVAGVLAVALARATRAPEPPELVCAGRTDAGVHARGQVVHVELPAELPAVRSRCGHRPMAPEDLCSAVNRQLAPVVVVRSASPAPRGFDARRSAVARRYRYLVWNGPQPDPLFAAFSWHVNAPLALRAMVSASDALVGEHDFRAFCRRSPAASPDQAIIRRVIDVGWSEEVGSSEEVTGREVADALCGWQTLSQDVNDAHDRAPAEGRLLRFEIEASSFCHQMVRSLVAALVEVGRGKATTATLVSRLRGAGRTGLPAPAPPHGLCLVSVTYPH